MKVTMGTRRTRRLYIVVILSGAVAGTNCGSDCGHEMPSVSERRPAAKKIEEVAKLSGDYFVLAFSERHVVSSGTMRLTFDQDKGTVVGNWDVDYVSGDPSVSASTVPVGDGAISGVFDINCGTLWLGLGVTTTFYGVAHLSDDYEKHTVFRGSWSHIGIVGESYGGLLQISDIDEPAKIEAKAGAAP